MTRVGDKPCVKGVQYTVKAIRHAGTGKFFGKYVFTLEAPDGTRHRAYGKTVSHNSTLAPIPLDCDYESTFPDADHVCDDGRCCECGANDHCCGHSRCPVNAAQAD